MRRLLAGLTIVFSSAFFTSHAQAQWKTIPCSNLKFTAPVQFSDCQYELNALREIYAGYFHDGNSSLAVAVYTHPRGMNIEDGQSYARGAAAYRPFLEKYPSPSQILPAGKWLTFPAVVKAPTGSRNMNCLQFFKAGPPRSQGYSWTMVALMCVKDGEVPVSAADLILNGIQVNLK